jgi:hypothetical protein
VRRAQLPEPGGGAAILLWTIAAAAVPGIIFAGLPPILTAVTGVVFVPAVASAAAEKAQAERILLEDAVRPQPRADDIA